MKSSWQAFSINFGNLAVTLISMRYKSVNEVYVSTEVTLR